MTLKLTTLLLLVAAACMTSNQVSAQAFDKSAYAKGLKFTNADSSLYLKFALRMQNLVQVTKEVGKPVKSRFLVRRFRLKFDGYLLSPRAVYKVEIGQSNIDVGGGGNLLLDAVLKYNVTENLWFWFGQTKLPGNRERVVSSQSLETVDRSLVNSFFNIDRDFGIQLRHHIKLGTAIIKEEVALSLGEGRNFTSDLDGGYSYTGRIEFLPLGKFTSKGDYFLSDLKRERKPKIAFGVGVDYNEKAIREKGQRGTQLGFSRSLSSVMADMIFKYRGFSTLVEWFDKRADDPFGAAEKLLDPSITGTFYTGSGYTGQASYTFKGNWACVGRFTSVAPDAETFLLDENQYTFGFSKFIVNHKFKVQTDFTFRDYRGVQPERYMWRFHMEIGL